MDNTEIKQVEITPEIIEEFKQKGLDVDRFYGPTELAELKIITSKGKSLADHQFIRREIQRGKLKAVQEQAEGRPNYKYKKVRGMWVLEYLNSRGLLIK